ncbi:MAG: 1-phosphofructokinase [Lachnospiraceae bacterium]|nr:1-phosphofructokinase [Lachnospiraceae bacterium]
MITTITLNPAIDKTCIIPELSPGRVNRLEQVKNVPGGKGINVAKVLLQYDYPVRTMGFLGGYTGEFIEDGIRKMGAECRFTKVDGDTRVNTNILAHDGSVTEVLEPGPVVSDEKLAAFLETYEEVLKDSDMMILSGSVAKGIPEAIYGELVLRAKRAGKKALLDTSGVYLKHGMAEKPFMVKPNIYELEGYLGRSLRSETDIVNAVRELLATGISHVLLSMGEKGLYYGCEAGIYFALPPRVKAVNTVGCGDSVVASFAMSMAEGKEQEDLLCSAVAISAANATTMENGVIPKQTAADLMQKITVRRCE